MESETKKDTTREDALNSITRIKENNLYLPLFNLGYGYIIDEMDFFYYDYTQEQKTDLYTVAIALSHKLINANDIDVEEINRNATNMNEQFKNSVQSMCHTLRKTSGAITLK